MITYFALDLKSKKFYVGSTTGSIDERVKNHKKEGKYPFQRALRKRPETFFWIWGEDFTENREEEQFYLDFYFGFPSCYNMCPKANTPPFHKGKTRTQKTKDMIAESKRGKSRPDVSQRLLKNGSPRRKTPLRDEEIERFREMAKNRSDEHNKKLAESKIGKRGYTDGVTYKMFFPGQQPEGWILGKPDHYWRPIRNEKGQFLNKKLAK